MKISVLLPTRNRVDMVIKTLNSLYNTISDKNRLEVILGLDSDDPSITNLKTKLEEFHGCDIKLSIFNERHGYVNLHKYINRLAFEADGDWLYLWNDDSYIITKDWDKLLEPYNKTFALLSPKVKETPNYPGTMFPFIPKKWIEITGHYSLNCHNDTWVEEVAKKLDIFVYIPMWVSHLREEFRSGQLTDQTWQERVQDKKGFQSDIMKNHRMTDIQKLKNFINKNHE
jgi:hypothetical protein